jgi:hypothetical protein
VIVISMLLVIIAFVTLMLGVLNITIAGVEPLTFVYATIAACLLAGLFLVVGVLRSRPSRKPAVASGDKAREPSWSGASLWQPDEQGAPRDRQEPEAGTATEAERADAPAGTEAPRGGTDAAGAGTEEAPRTGGDAAPAGPAGPAEADVEARLLAVPGVGPAKRRALLEHFGSHAALAAAGVEDIAAVKGVSDALARRIHDSLHG